MVAGESPGGSERYRLILPKVLAVAAGSVFVAGSVSALALGGADPARSVTLTPVAAGSALRSSHPAPSGGTAGVAGGASTAVAGASASTGGPAVAASKPIGGGLAVPASGVPLSSGADPAGPAVTPSGSSGLPPVVLPEPTAASLPAVAPLRQQISPDAVVMLNSALTPDQTRALSRLRGVNYVESVDTGTVALGGAPVVAFGVEPATFRRFTPAASASSDQLWRYLEAGSLVSSYSMAGDRGLKLGTTEEVTPSAVAGTLAPVKGWLGAIASIGLPGVDLLVDHRYSADLGLVPNSGLVVSAPDLSGSALRSELTSALPGAAVELLHADQIPQTLPGDTLDSATRQRIVSAALSRVGLPYVWGAVGPESFDCSGLVQWAYRQAGILMPRVAAEQFLTGDHIPLADAQPGDLLFWTYDPTDPGYVDHTAIYLGNGQMVVAPHTGLDVQVTSVPTDQFAGAVAVVLASH